MIIVRLTGGLGNQLFQYAIGRRLGVRHGTELLVDTSGYGPNGETRPKELAEFSRPLRLFEFRVNVRKALPEEIACLRDDFYRATTCDRIVRRVRRLWPGFLWNDSHIVERQYRFQPEALEFADNVYLQGFWQRPKYFEDIAALLRTEIQPVDAELLQAARQTVEKLKKQFSRVVSLHVRRGDLAYANEVLHKENITHGPPVGMEYIRLAMQKFDSSVCFFVVSDSPKDIAWCRANIRAKNIEFSTAESDVWDFTAMRYCDDHIIANSTFSWWAAWLDNNPDRRVVAPRIWSSPQPSPARRSIETEDLLLANWNVI